MDYDQIIALLSKHFEGKTTRREELFLRNLYFENKDLYSSLKKYISLFLHFYQAKREVFPKRIRKKISNTYFAFAASLLFLIDLFIGQSTYNFDKKDIVHESAIIEEYDNSKTNIIYLSENLQ